MDKYGDGWVLGNHMDLGKYGPTRLLRSRNPLIGPMKKIVSIIRFSLGKGEQWHPHWNCTGTAIANGTTIKIEVKKEKTTFEVLDHPNRDEQSEPNQSRAWPSQRKF